MMRQITTINWSYIGDAIPAFVTVMFIPFGYSAAYGLIAGLMVYTALNGMIYLTKLVSGGRIVPDDEDRREYWTSEYLYPWLVAQTLTLESVTPHGRLPWFFTASQAFADQVRGRHDRGREGSASVREDGWDYQDRLGSKGSTHDAELERIVVPAMPRDPDREKVLRKT